VRELAGIHSERVTMLETSRGCPHGCVFCETTRFHGGVWRARTPENVVKDINLLVTQHGADIIHVVDDNFTADPERALKIYERLRGGPRPLFFIFSARSDDLLSIPEFVSKLAEARFLRANVGVETVDSALSRRIGKEISLEQHRRAFSAMRASGIFSVASFIVGLPGETDEIRRRNLEFAVEYVDVAHFLPFQPLPGIPIGDGSGIPDNKHVEYSVELKREFDGHPTVLDRLVKAAEGSNVRGLLAREALHKKLDEKALNPREDERVRDILKNLYSES